MNASVSCEQRNLVEPWLNILILKSPGPFGFPVSEIFKRNLIPIGDVIKLFFGGNIDFPKIKKWKIVCSDALH